ncbi:LysE family transporter [Methanolobus halotolerans]|uniref:Lysine transporter LysE n=1 Tax=Methanolobus halotolerans TaxID=2052935 RepID=A0A4E0QRU0_9EURY|nr:LysE family transporter [Methanolobus halotolerans]TGC09411.1 lysine transporter LysE [Methanolobus halotolerans]
MVTDPFNLATAFFLGFTIGVSAAIVPGPMMFATIGLSLKNGWRTGLYVFGGHSIVESALILLIIMGASTFIMEDMLSHIAIVGGLAMMLFGIIIIRKAQEAFTIDIPASAGKIDISGGPVSAGILTSALNPTFLFWWLTAGSAIIMQQYMAGISAVLAFVIGHWFADIGFLIAVSASFSRSNDFLSRNTHRRLLYTCGIILTSIGFFFIINHNNAAAMI